MPDSPTFPSTTRRDPIAVVGVSALFPGSADADGFWHDILAGRDLISEVPPSHWLPEDYFDPDPKAPDKTYAKRGGFLSEIDFDPLAFGIPPTIVPATDTSQLLALIVARQVLDDAAAGQFSKLDKSRISVILGVTSAQELIGESVSRLQRPVWVKALRESGIPEDQVEEICNRIAGHYSPWQESTFPGLLGNVVAGRIANRFDLGGANMVTDAACASALAALSMATNELRLGSSDMVIAGGVDTLNDIFMFMCFSKTPALSATGDCRPFSDRADGTLLGEGLGMVALKRLEDAERDGDRIYAVIRGIGASSDGRAKSVYAPVPEGQAKALGRAYEEAGYTPDTVELVEAHGTATKAGDAAELEGLKLAFQKRSEEGAEDSGRRQWCALGSVKSQIGHTKAAAGVAGLFKAVMALHHKILPPTIKVERPNPALDLESSPFYLNTKARPWIGNGDHPRRASVSSFGFGGSNYHVAVEEYLGTSPRPPRVRTAEEELVLVTADSAAELVESATEMANEAEPGRLQWLAADSQKRFTPATYRLAVMARDEDDLRRKLTAAGERINDEPEATFNAPGIFYGCGEHQGKVAFLFPGQGSQYPGMGASLAMTFDRAREVWDRSAALALAGTKRLHEVVFARSAWSDQERQEQLEELTATRWTQPAIGAVSLSMLALLRVAGVHAQCVAGHSYGELAALYAAGSFTEESLLELSRKRGELMEGATSIASTMTAVDLSSEELSEHLEEWGHEVVIANHNAPRQVVLSGVTAEIEAVEKRLAAASIAFRRLPVAAAFHSPLLSDVATDFRADLDRREIAAPQIPVYSNSEAKPYPADPEGVRRVLAEQIVRPVRFQELLEAMAESGVRTFIEVGPGSVLTSLVARNLGDGYLAVSLDRKKRDGVTSLWEAFGRLAVAGLPIDFAALWEPFGEIRDPKLTAKPKLALKIKGSNYGKIYPPAGGAAELPPPNPPRSAIEPVEEIRREPIPEPEAPAEPVASPVPVASPEPVEPAPQVAAGSEWLQAYQEAQRQTVDAHLAFQKSMVEAQTAFLQTVEASFTGLRQPWDMPPDTELPKPELRPAGLRGQSEPLSEPAAQPPVSMERTRQPTPQQVAPPPATPQPTAPLQAASQSATPPAPVVAVERPVASPPATDEAPAAPTSAGVELESLMLEVVAEKTGYPPEMLDLEMDLESDLGIDSIKRVEILATVRDREPDLPEVDTTQLATLRTLGQIVEFLADRPAAATPPPAPSSTPPTPLTATAESTAAASVDAVDVEGLMLEVVAEKTGYPPEMLDLEMDLESDLGIDSIKRVEILAAVRDREPDLPEVDTAQLATLRTLGQIVDFLGVSQTTVAPASDAPVSETPASEAPAPPLSIGRYALRPVAAPPTGLALPGLATAQRVAVTDDGGGIAVAVVAELGRRGVMAEVLSEVSLASDATAVLILDGLTEVTDLEQAFEINRRTFRVARAAAQQVADGGILVTVQDTGGDFGFSETSPVRAALGGLAGLAKTAALEWPTAAVQAIDIERGERSPTEIASVLVEELFEGGAELEVGLRADGSRLTLESYPEPLGELPEDKRPGGVIVASGGARGVTAATLLALARETEDLHLVLLGRTSLEEEPAACRGVEGEAELKRALLAAAREAGEQITPLELTARARRVLAGREIQQNLAALAAAGATARYLPADVRDPDSLAAALEPIRREWGPITGLVHGAGVIADKPLAEKTDDQFDRVFDTKVRGLTALLAATAEDPLQLICLFSSVSARCGNVGQVDYAMANEVLNKIAAAERRKRLAGGCTVKSLNWGPWEGGMVTPELKARFEALGVPLIPLAAGAQMLVGELTGAAPAEQVEVVLGGDPNQGLRAAEGGGTLEMEAVVDVRSYPYLESHSIDGVPVVPVVMAIEWFARVATAHCPDLRLAGCRDVEVVRGVVLERFHDRAEVLRISSRVASGSRDDGCDLALEIRDRDGALRYRAVAEMVSGAQEPPGAGPAATGLQPWSEAEIYDGQVLFHGPLLQVIRQVEGISDQGIAGSLDGSREMGWGNDSWRTDAAALDGGLQLAVLWFKHQHGDASLPMKIGTFKSYAQMPTSGLLRAVLRNRLAGADRAVADIVLSNGDGSRVAELRQVEIYRRPTAPKTTAAEPVAVASGKVS